MRRLLLIGLALTAVFIGGFAVAMALGVLSSEQIERWLSQPGSRWMIAAMVALLLAADLVLPVPATPLMVIAGRLLGPVAGGLACCIGALGGAVIGYAAGRLGAKHLVGTAERASAQQCLDDYGLLAIVIARGLPVLPEVLVCVGGAASLPAARFLGLYALVTVPWVFLHTFAGAYSTTTYPWPAILVLIGVPAAVFALWRMLARRA